jgi:hypothetical protein
MTRATLVSILSLVALAALGFAMFSLVGTPVGWKADDFVDRDTGAEAVTRGYRLEAEGGDATLKLTCTPNAPIAAILVAEAPFAAKPVANIAIDGAAPAARPVTVVGASAILADAKSPDGRAFVDRISASRRITIALDGGATPFTATFETTGADDAVTDLRHVCV